MTDTDLRTTFDAVAEAVPVPPIDRLGFERRLRGDRRRRAAGRTLVGIAAVTALVAGGVAVRDVVAGGDGTAPDGAAGAPATATTAPQTVAVAVQGRLLVLTPDGVAHDSAVRVEEVLALTEHGVVAIGSESSLLLVPVRKDGSVGEPRPIVDGPTQRAAVSPDGSQVAYVDLDDVAHVLDLVTGDEIAPAVALGRHEQLRSVDDGALLTGTGAGMAVHDGGTTAVTGPEEDTGGQMAGGVVSYQTYGGVFMFDVDGTERTGELGAGIGGLSTDGAAYASAPADWQIDDGMSDILEVIDTATGDRQVMGGFDGRAIEIRWTSADRFLVTAEAPDHGGVVLLDCARSAEQCEQRYEDPSATLRLPSR